MITGERVSLREKRLSDAYNDYCWQTDPELSRLDATPMLDIPYAEYLLYYARQLQEPSASRRLYAVEARDGGHIGNCTYYNIDEASAEAEMGIMIGAAGYRGKGYGTDAVRVLVNYIFESTGLKRIYLKTLDWNERAQRCFARCGFAPCGYRSQDGYRFVMMELGRKQWAKQQVKSER